MPYGVSINTNRLYWIIYTRKKILRIDYKSSLRSKCYSFQLLSRESIFEYPFHSIKKECVSTSVIIRFWCKEHHLGYFCSPPKVKKHCILTVLCNTIFQYRITFYAYSNTFTVLWHGWFLIAKLQKKDCMDLTFFEYILPDKYESLHKQISINVIIT